MEYKRELNIKRCNRCGFTWCARTEDPVTCGNPKCRSPYWNRPAEERRATRGVMASPAS